MTQEEQFTTFINKYMILRTKQKHYFNHRDKTTLKECKLLEMSLDAIAQRLMIEYDMNFSISPEQPKLF